MLGAATIYAELLGDVAARLAQLDVGDPCTNNICPARGNRDVALRQNARYLLACLAAPAGTIVRALLELARAVLSAIRARLGDWRDARGASDRSRR